MARRLGYDPFVAVSMNTIVAELRGDGEGLRARVYVIHDGNSAGGTRELTAPTRNCTELIAAVALAMNIAVDLDALDRAEPELVTAVANAIGTVAKEESAQTSAPRAATTNSKNAPASHSSIRDVSPRELGQAVSFSAGIGAAGATGLAPAPVFGLALNAAARMHNWALSFEPEATLPSTSSTTASGAHPQMSAHRLLKSYTDEFELDKIRVDERFVYFHGVNSSTDSPGRNHNGFIGAVPK